jgi:hypothetical protein
MVGIAGGIGDAASGFLISADDDDRKSLSGLARQGTYQEDGAGTVTAQDKGSAAHESPKSSGEDFSRLPNIDAAGKGTNRASADFLLQRCFMQSKLVSTEANPRTWVLVLASGEEVKKTILKFASDNDLRAASFVALGAFEQAQLAYFDWQAKKYQPIPIDEQVEVITMTGDIAENEENAPDMHAHVILGRRDGTTRGGHLMQAIVRPTLELTMTETPAHLKRRMHKDIHVALIDIS